MVSVLLKVISLVDFNSQFFLRVRGTSSDVMELTLFKLLKGDFGTERVAAGR